MWKCLSIRLLAESCIGQHVKKKTNGVLMPVRRYKIDRKQGKFKAFLDSSFNEKETVQILSHFNKGSESQLLSIKLLTIPKVRSIIHHRTVYGDFNYVSSLLDIPGIGFIGLNKICETLKDEDYSEDAEVNDILADDVYAQCHPMLSAKACQQISRIASLEIEQDKIHFAVVNKNLQLEEWGHSKISTKLLRKYDHSTYIEKLNAVVESLPQADIYIMETKQYKCSNLKIVPYIINLRILEAMITTIINKDFLTTQQHKIYTLKPSTVNKCFGLSIGGERTSGQQIIQDIINNMGEHNDVKIPTVLSEYYLSLHSEDKEYRSNSLLQSIAFYKLIIFPRC